MTTAFIRHKDCFLHEMGNVHPESPQRLSAIEDALKEAKVFDLLDQHEAPLATREQVELIHSRNYIDFLHENSPSEGYLHLDMDTAMNSHTLDAAYRAVGAVIKAVDLVVAGEALNAFCNVRPPGHHAEKDKAFGFCFFNNIAIGGAYALKNKEIKRIAVIDFDVHHGNGTEHAFLKNKDVLICSSFQHPLFPGKEFKTRSSRIINVTLPQGTTSKEFRSAVEQQWIPHIDSFKPDLFFISAGFDAHWKDPLAEINLNENDFGWVTERIMELANKYSKGRIVSSLEGGYHLQALGASAVKHIRALMNV